MSPNANGTDYHVAGPDFLVILREITAYILVTAPARSPSRTRCKAASTRSFVASAASTRMLSPSHDSFDKMLHVWASAAPIRSLKKGRPSVGAGQECEKMRYSNGFKAATMQSNIAGLKSKVERMAEQKRRWTERIED